MTALRPLVEVLRSIQDTEPAAVIAVDFPRDVEVTRWCGAPTASGVRVDGVFVWRSSNLPCSVQVANAVPATSNVSATAMTTSRVRMRSTFRQTVGVR